MEFKRFFSYLSAVPSTNSSVHNRSSSVTSLSWKSRRASGAQSRTNWSALMPSRGAIASEMPRTHRPVFDEDVSTCKVSIVAEKLERNNNNIYLISLTEALRRTDCDRSERFAALHGQVLDSTRGIEADRGAEQNGVGGTHLQRNFSRYYLLMSRTDHRKQNKKLHNIPIHEN